MASLGFSGVFSGIDTDVLVAATMAAARMQLNRYTSQQDGWEAKKDAVEEIERRMQQLQDLVDDLRDANDLRRVDAHPSDRDVLTASATGGAIEGVHEVVINQLAQGEREVNDGVTPTEAWTHATGVADGDDEYISADDISDNAGEDYKFVFQFGSESQVAVDLSGYDATGITLNELVSEINTAAGYTAASAVLDGGQYKLRIEAANAGEDHSLVIADDDSVGALDGTDDFTQTVDGDVGTDALIGAGTFAYTYNGVTRTLTTTADTTLGELRDLINNDAENPGAQASILEYDGATGGKYHLVLSGRDTGEDYTITIEAATTLSGFGTGDWTQTRAAQNSQIRVDGYPSGDWIESSSNTVTSVIPGVTLNLLATNAATPVTVNLIRNTNDLKSSLQNLVGIYNGLVDRVNEYAEYNPATDVAGVLIGDSSLNLLLAQVRLLLTSGQAGFDSDDDTYTMAAEIGIEIDRDGYLSIDETVLDEALSEDYFGVLELIGAAGIGGSDSQYVQFNSADSGTTAGTYEVKANVDADGNVIAGQAWFRTEGEGESDWRLATIDGNVLTGATGNPEQWLQVTIVADPGQAGSPYTQTAEVRVQQGFGGALYDQLEETLDSVDGPLAIKKNRYDNAIDQLEDRIDAEEDRLADQEERLRAKYARLEATLAQLDSFRAAFDAMFTALNAINSRATSGGTT